MRGRLALIMNGVAGLGAGPMTEGTGPAAKRRYLPLVAAMPGDRRLTAAVQAVLTLRHRAG